ncbi:TetR/AcrR family transcriptional regulator [Geomonas sp. RF6]|uniref:TetR/AcrR family transcriptional regulator n=1 Tax=Geomonas sp. RF6 TaxID=2897342 RepID=UPI001E65A747|nr:TetR/AcrR family transcriptional regulator [Geomonas sp. RF6]UFS72524.1 TetR/AcrR family transcriptional regulator [Geomonas sp. RF6]
MEKRDTKAEIITAGTAMISLQGYNATGIDAVLKQVGVPKGSFYHYFGSKEEFGLAIIDRFAERYDQRLHTFLQDEEVTPLNRIRNYLESGLARLEQNQCSKGCLIGNLGQELADQNERFRARLDAIFGNWKERFAACLREAQNAGELTRDVDAETVAGFILSGWEGAILRAKVMKSPQPLRDFISILFSCVLCKGKESRD